jgi:beta-lactamase class A
MQLSEQISALAGAFSGKLGVAAKNLTTGETFAYQADEPFHPASTIKLPVLAALWQEIEGGRVTLEESLPLDASLCFPDGGVMDGFTPGFAYPVRDLAHLMITISDNTATNLLIKRLGFETVNRLMAGCGMAGTRLGRYIAVPGQDPSLPPNQTTPADMARLLELLATDRLVTPRACQEMLKTMLQQKYHFLTTRYIDEWDEELPPEKTTVRVASKSGWFRTVRNDVAVIWAPRATYVLAMFSKDCKDDSYKLENEAAILLPKVSRAIYYAWGKAQ